MLTLLILAIGLAMDAFALALVRGGQGPRGLRPALAVGLAFGGAQGLMPLIGWSIGLLFVQWIAAWDHWLAFALLTVLGGRMLFTSNDGNEGADDESSSVGGPMGLAALALAALATSVDAAAAGLTLPALGTPVLLSCLVIGVVTALLCVIGYAAGAWLPGRGSRAAEMIGGLILIGIGTRILIVHLSA